MTKDTQARKYQLTINNPTEKGLNHDKIAEILQKMKSTVYYCLSDEIGTDEETPHTHIFVAFSSPVRFSTIKNAFPSAHIEKALGTSQENRDYIQKCGKWKNTSKSETSVEGSFEEFGAMPEERQGSRSDLDIIQDYIEQGLTPRQILSMDIKNYRYERMIKQAYLEKRVAATPLVKDMHNEWHVGGSGSGKTYYYIELCEKYSPDDIYICNDFQNGGFDLYIENGAPPILFLDEFKGNMPFSQLLTILDKYSRTQTHCRYSNTYNLWNRVIITSIYPPEEVYRQMVDIENRHTDKFEQLIRRLDRIVYHAKFLGEDYRTFSIPANEYQGYNDLKYRFLRESDSIDVGTDNIFYSEIHINEEINKRCQPVISFGKKIQNE